MDVLQIKSVSTRTAVSEIRKSQEEGVLNDKHGSDEEEYVSENLHSAQASDNKIVA